jgi:superoxide dismutase, Fe-Mn family
MDMKILAITLLGIVATVSIQASAQNIADQAAPDQFPALPYAYTALEPYIDAATMELHYSKHHQGYFNNFKAAVKGTALEQESLRTLFSKISTLSATVRNNGGGYYNHVLFWDNLSPNQQEIPEALKKAIVAKFGSIDQFKADFGKAALSVFGSGWAWLVLDANNQLAITSTPNQDNPLMDVAAVKGEPLLALDVWEHAYYLKYQNKRASYIDAFWSVVNWNVVAARMSAAKK